jgi:hypothetical protein
MQDTTRVVRPVDSAQRPHVRRGCTAGFVGSIRMLAASRALESRKIRSLRLLDILQLQAAVPGPAQEAIV